jgi:hypothetical protein
MAASSVTHPRLGIPQNRGPRMLVTLPIAVMGGVVALALALMVGAVHTTQPITAVVQTAPATKPPSSPSPTRASVYAGADAGVVDITVQPTATVNTPFRNHAGAGDRHGSRVRAGQPR